MPEAGPGKSLSAAPGAIADDLADDAVDRARRFGGVSRLYGPAGLAAFERASVAVIGIGGVGSWVAEALSRNAIGHLTLIDLDNVAESNTNRQIHALDGNYGKPKVAAMAERIALIDPGCSVTQIEDFISVDNLDALLGGGFDYVVDAIDSVRTKTALIAWCHARQQPMITVGGAGGQLDPTLIRIADLARTIQDPLLSKVRAQLRKQHGFARGPKARFRISAVYSEEPLQYPERQGARPFVATKAATTAATTAEPSNAAAGAQPGVDREGAADGAADDLGTDAQAGGWMTGLNCAGFGSSVCVTASFGFAAAAHVLTALAKAGARTAWAAPEI